MDAFSVWDSFLYSPWRECKVECAFIKLPKLFGSFSNFDLAELAAEKKHREKKSIRLFTVNFSPTHIHFRKSLKLSQRRDVYHHKKKSCCCFLSFKATIESWCHSETFLSYLFGGNVKIAYNAIFGRNSPWHLLNDTIPKLGNFYSYTSLKHYENKLTKSIWSTDI